MNVAKKGIAMNHPPILFSDIPVKTVQENKHLGIVLDSKLSLASHVKSITFISRQGIEMLRFLSR